jgi:hypothetical protein
MSTATLPPTVRRLPRYDLTAFHASIRPTDLFICSYPKSGTTWLGYLLANLIKPDPAEALDLKSFNRYVPDVNLEYTKRGSLHEHDALADPRLFLCHAASDARLPKVVYVLRDPRDVMVSYWHYQKFLGRQMDQTLADYLRREDHWPCEWDAHVASWLCPRLHPNLEVVRYEDLHTDAEGSIRRVLDLAGIVCTDERIRAAVEAARFEKMRKAEERHGVNGRAANSDEKFVRKGRVGGWQEEMGPEALRILEERYGEVMRQVGYQTLT